MHRKPCIVLLTILFSLLCAAAVSAQDGSLPPSALIGTASTYLNEVRELPMKIDEALCLGDKEGYQAGMRELATAVSNAADTIRLMRMDVPFGLWDVYVTIAANPVCGIVTAATGAADSARDRWEVQAYAAGLYETKKNEPPRRILRDPINFDSILGKGLNETIHLLDEEEQKNVIDSILARGENPDDYVVYDVSLFLTLSGDSGEYIVLYRNKDPLLSTAIGYIPTDREEADNDICTRDLSFTYPEGLLYLCRP